MNSATGSMKRLGALASAISMCSLMLSGCSTMSGASPDKDDVCAAQRAAFTNAESHYGVSILKGALAGALIGAGSAALIGAASGNNVGKSAAIGAGTGAVAGGLAGYFVEKQRTTPDPQALANAIQSDVVAENTQIDNATVAFTQLRQCRFAAADQVKADYAAGRISREEAVLRLDALKKRFDGDVLAAQQMGVKMNDKAKEFQYASDQLVKEDPQAQTVIAEESPSIASSGKKPAAAKPHRTLPPKSKAIVDTAQASETNLTKAKTFDNDVVQAKADAASQFSLQGSVGAISHGTEVCRAD